VPDEHVEPVDVETLHGSAANAPRKEELNESVVCANCPSQNWMFCFPTVADTGNVPDMFAVPPDPSQSLTLIGLPVCCVDIAE
jgi:hypothetical protein